MTCSVPNCKNIWRLMNPSTGITFHRFPKGERFTIFKEIIGRPDLKWHPRKYICSEHFLESDFVQGKRRVLKKSAMPSQKVGHSSVGTSETTRERKRHRSSSSTGSSEESDKENINKDKKMSTNVPSTSFPSNISESCEILPHSSSSSSPKQVQYFRQPAAGKSPSCTSSASSTSEGTKQKRVSLIKSVHSYSMSPGKQRKTVVEAREKCKKYAVALSKARKRVRQLQKKVISLEQIANELKANNMLSEKGVDYLQRVANDVPAELLKRFVKNVENETITREEYPPNLRKFAMTLQFFSCRAYEYVRETFNLSLPHQSTLRKWCASVEYEPGFSHICFDVLKKMSESKGTNLTCSLLFDEMAIKKKIEFDGKKTWGYSDFGLSMEDDDLEPATEVFVLTVVSHTDRWKLPIGYFFIKSLSSQDRANIVKEALICLNDVRVDITSVTCDGPAAHFAMFRELGCDWSDLSNIKSFFLHPSTGVKVYAVIDVCHLLKLVRNNFANLKTILDENGQRIEWNFIEKLHRVQEQEGLRIGNKLKSAHINWESQKMKVSLAAQTLSQSVADSLEFLNTDLKDKDFLNCEATIRFIKMINQLFDILNSKNPFGKAFKSPLTVENQEMWQNFLVETQRYLLSLTDVNGKFLWQTKKKTPIIGFALTIQSVIGIFQDYVLANKLQYILTYKLSQDHLEMFFCSIRSRNGWNNNPSCLQFYHSYKKLLLHARIPGEGGNCRVLDTTCILDISSAEVQNPSIHPEDITYIRKYNIDIENLASDHDYDVLDAQLNLDMFIENVVTYVSGYVVKMMFRTTRCDSCLLSLLSDDNHSSADYRLIQRKNRGGLLVPSRGVKTICSYTEKSIRILLSLNENNIPRDKIMINILTSSIYENFKELYMEDINKYFPLFCSESLFEDHRVNLVKSIINNYTKIRIYNLCKKISDDVQGPQIRQKFTKLILFKHQ